MLAAACPGADKLRPSWPGGSDALRAVCAGGPRALRRRRLGGRGGIASATSSAPLSRALSTRGSGAMKVGRCGQAGAAGTVAAITPALRSAGAGGTCCVAAAAAPAPTGGPVLMAGLAQCAAAPPRAGGSVAAGSCDDAVGVGGLDVGIAWSSCEPDQLTRRPAAGTVAGGRHQIHSGAASGGFQALPPWDLLGAWAADHPVVLLGAGDPPGDARQGPAQPERALLCPCKHASPAGHWRGLYALVPSLSPLVGEGAVQRIFSWLGAVLS